jgi:hypothetical protein
MKPALPKSTKHFFQEFQSRGEEFLKDSEKAMRKKNADIRNQDIDKMKHQETLVFFILVIIE